MRAWRVGRTLRIGSVAVLLSAAAFPFYWMLVTSTTADGRLFGRQAQLVPDLSRLNVFADVLSGNAVRVWLTNSAIVALGTTVLTTCLATLTAYGLSRFRFRGKGLVGLGLFVTQMLPEAMLVVPLFAIFRQLNLLNGLTGLILANTAFTVPVVTWVLKSAIDGVPIEVEEAARVDGCSRFGLVLTVVVPLIAPSLAAAAVISFFHGWNEYVFAQTFLSDERLHTASVGLAGFVGELSTPIQSVMAVGIMYTLPAVVFYLFVQRFIVSGMTAGSVKG